MPENCVRNLEASDYDDFRRIIKRRILSIINETDEERRARGAFESTLCLIGPFQKLRWVVNLMEFSPRLSVLERERWLDNLI